MRKEKGTSRATQFALHIYRRIAIRMTRHITALVVCMVALSGIALAGPCLATSVFLLEGTSCSIGTLNFNFGTWNPATIATAKHVEFTPITTPELGFELSTLPSGGSFSSTSFVQGQLNFIVSTASIISGLSTVVNGSNFTGKPSGAYTESYLSAPPEAASDKETWNGTAATDHPNPSGPIGLNSADGSASIYLKNASFKSATFLFATPEPGVWLSLIAVGALMILPIRRLQRRPTD